MLHNGMSALYAENGIEYAVDDVSWALSDPTTVHDGRATEMNFFDGMKVYDRVPREEQLKTSGKITGTKWIYVNKGDIDKPNIHCWLVGKKFRTTPVDALYASTPLTEALRLTGPTPRQEHAGPVTLVLIRNTRRGIEWAANTL